jgi:hypothetical protein
MLYDIWPDDGLKMGWKIVAQNISFGILIRLSTHQKNYLEQILQDYGSEI